MLAVQADTATTIRATIGEVKPEVEMSSFVEGNGVFVEASDSGHSVFVIEGTDEEAAQPGKVSHQPQPIEAGGHAERAMLRDIDVILARVEEGLTTERIRMDGLLARLFRHGKS